MDAASLQAITMLFYGSVETPYTLVIAGMIITRIWEKDHQMKIMHTCTGLMDCIYVSVLLYMGYSGSVMYLVPLVLLSRLLADHMIHIVENQ